MMADYSWSSLQNRDARAHKGVAVEKDFLG